MDVCKNRGCSRAIYNKKRHFCRSHFEAWWRVNRPFVKCKINGCFNNKWARSLCEKHYSRLRRYSDVNYITPREEYTAKGKQLPQYKHGLESHPLYATWYGMNYRCHNSNNPAYSRYGGRGIIVCDRWRKSPQKFIDDMGPKPHGTSIDRINNDGDYEPSNCRWATAKQQRANRQDSSL